ncbi:MAG: hypothetical protein P4L50_16440, partial [Anaerolineaceae bacterium]|nr:hypothetical protein [Anaerolineaceae bacterium]
MQKQKEERHGNLWHLSTQQLSEIMRCKGIALPASGSGKGLKLGKPVKRDYIKAIEMALGGADKVPKMRDKDAKVKPKRQTGQLWAAPLVPFVGKVGGSYWESLIELEIGTALPERCISAHEGFVEREQLNLPHYETLSSSVAGFRVTIWRDLSNTLIVQDLGVDPIAVDLWNLQMTKRADPPRWSNEKAAILYEPLRVKDLWMCKAANEHYYAFTLIDGLWNVSLEGLFRSIPQKDRDSYPLISILDIVAKYVTDYSSNSGSKAGRDTQHYAWRYEKDPYGKTWLVLGLLPL